MYAQVFALQLVKDLLWREWGGQKIPTAIHALIEATITALQRGDGPPEKDGASLIEVWRAEYSAGDQAAAPRSSEFMRWWQAREARICLTCQDQACSWVPQLGYRKGGGRGLPSIYFMQLQPLLAEEVTEDFEAGAANGLSAGGLRYRIDPLKPSLWMHIVLGDRPFRLKSWRGLVLFGVFTGQLALIGLIWLLIAASWFLHRPTSAVDIVAIVVAIGLSWLLWRNCRPIWQLPYRRVSLAPDGLLPMNTLHGQLRTMHQGDSRIPGRVFSLVRHWGICPLCAAEVDLADGGKAFPDRLVGRCSDAPLEHVFSFDPVRLVGMGLRH